MMRRVQFFVRYTEAKNVVLDLPVGALYRDDVTCPKCGHRGVYYWRRHRASAESSDTIEKVWRCPNCGYEWIETEG